MTKQSFLAYCLDTYGTLPDYPFDEDFETAVLRHANTRKWYAIVMRGSRRKFGFESDECIDIAPITNEALKARIEYMKRHFYSTNK